MRCAVAGVVGGLAVVLGACAEPAAHTSTAAGPERAAALSSPSARADYARAVAGMRAIDALRGAHMTDALATDLEFKCADLREMQTRLKAEKDPLVWHVRSRIDQTCRYDVPLACALFALERMATKRARDPSANLKGDCNGVRVALGDVGTGYLQNPTVVDAGVKLLAYCESGGDVTVTREAP